MAYRIIRLPEVCAKTGRPKSTLYDLIAKGLFPRPIKIGLRTSGWLEDEPDAINAAYAKGQSEDDIRQLVKELEAARAAGRKVRQ